jgi:hypothetical protein
LAVHKRSGYRAITVSGRRFKWRFGGTVVVVPDGVRGRQILEIDFGWFDEWLYMNQPEKRPPQFSPAVATPGFVSKGIQFAIDNGWNTEKRGGKFLLRYSACGGFQKQVASDHADSSGDS